MHCAFHTHTSLCSHNVECSYIVHELSLYFLAPCGSPGGVTVNYVLPATTAKLSWNPVPKHKQNGVITGYSVQVTRADLSFTQEIIVEEAEATSYEIPNLTPFTSYVFSISAKTKAGTGPAATVSSRTPETGMINLYNFLQKVNHN